METTDGERFHRAFTPILTSFPAGGGACPGFEFRIRHKFLLTSVEVLRAV
jgi:hypothetical protein